VNVATGAAVALVVAVMAASGRTALIGPAVVLVMALHFAPLAWTQRRLSPAVLGLIMELIGLFALLRGGSQANGSAAGRSAAAFDLAALHQLWLTRRARAALSH
jgi:xanthine/uracil permease